ncbi:21000_t:CDS:10 [Entrophospora sp. SA101]|nr:21000_t:CDS:10 [Entrophospora sp. SA101]
MSVEIGTKVEGECRTRRSRLSPDKLIDSPEEGVKTLYDVVQRSVKKYGDNKNALGYRKIERIVEEEKEVTKIVGGVEKKELKTWKYFQLSGYNWLTYNDLDQEIKTIGAGLVKLGLSEGSKIAIFAATSANWMLVTHGCFSQSMTIVTAYDTLGEEGLLHSMNEAEVNGIFTNADLLPMVKKVAGKCSTLKFIIYDGDAKGSVLQELSNAHSNLGIFTLEELKQLGKDYPINTNPPKSQDICCIMYTSGTTGNPKGVILTHANLVAAIGGVEKMLGHLIQEDDSFLAYLPLAHVLEFGVEHVCLWWGVTLGYGSPRTLTDSSVRNCLGDMCELKPSVMTGVPAVWESIRKGILSKVHGSSPTVQKIFDVAFKTKSWLMGKGLPSKPFDTLVFDKIKEQTGGRLRLALSGSAPISKETQEFLCVTLCPIFQGYGMTEACGMAGTILTPELFTYGSVGTPVPCTEVKLVDVPDAGYKSTDTPNPRGEIWLRGPAVTPGYYKNEKVTKETFTEDGWLQTGDIGEWKPDGCLAVIDRKKNLVKLAHGEYIALERLESVYKSTLFVSNICVCADSYQSRPVALIFPIEARVRKLAMEKNITETDFEKLCQDKEITNSVLQACLVEAKKADFKPAELLSAITLLHEEWTTENGLLTAAQKIKRRDIQQKYQGDIDRMYARFLFMLMKDARLEKIFRDEDAKDGTSCIRHQFLMKQLNPARTKRTGWVDNGIKDPESISDHMHRMSILALLLDDPTLDRNKCVKMAVVHDLAECIVEAMKHLCKELLNDSQQSKEIFDLWQEYEDGISNEAKFVKDLDKFELILQAFEYEQSQNKDLEEFFESTKGKFNHSLVKSWVGELYRKRMDVVKKEEIEDDIDDKEDVWIVQQSSHKWI